MNHTFLANDYHVTAFDLDPEAEVRIKDAVIASSIPGILPSVVLQSDCEHHPERTIVAHAFNPVYLMLSVGKKQKTHT